MRRLRCCHRRSSKSTTTFAGLRSTLAALEPLVAATKPQVKGLAGFASALNQFATTATPTLAELADLISNPQRPGSDRAAAGGAGARASGEHRLPGDHRVA